MKLLRAAVVLLFACSTLSLYSVGLSETQLSIGLLTELSGTEAPNGRACRLGYDVAARIFDGSAQMQKRVRLVYGDHRADPATALSEFKRLVEFEGISVILANRGPIGMALDPATKKEQIPFIGIVGHVNFIENNPYGFRVWVPMEQDGLALAETVVRMGYRRAAIVALHDDYILAMVAAFRRNFARLGGAVTYFDTIDRTMNDFSSVVSKLKTTNPDVIFANGEISQLGLLVRKIREQKLPQQIVSNFWLSYADVVQSAGIENIEGATFVGLDLRRPVFLKEAASLDSSVQITSLT